MDFTWKIGGEAGFGIMTTGLFFSKTVTRLGHNILDYIEYPSLIRGGHNAYEVRVSTDEVYSFKPTIDVLVCLNEDTYLFNKNRLNSDSIVIYDVDEFKPDSKYKLVGIPSTRILNEMKADFVMKNTFALAASLALLGAKPDVLNDLIQEQFQRKGENVVLYNQKFVDKAYEIINNKFSRLKLDNLKTEKTEDKLVMTGNDAFVVGSVIADCRTYYSYPMTPSSSVLTSLAYLQNKTGMIVRQPEDEIAGINLALGSSFAGVRSAVGTSGGGFALMNEAVSLAGITETPVVIFLASRPAPATGMPTWTEQGDLLYAVHSGHGEFPKIVLAPGDVEEMIDLTTKAFNLADTYQTPVFVMSDMYLSESHKSIDKKTVENLIKNYKINRGKIITNSNEKKYLRYKITSDGISPMIIPGFSKNYFQANSYEHEEDGHTTENSKARTDQVVKRNNKLRTYLNNDFSLPKIYGDLNKAETVFVSWGSTKGAVLDAQKTLLSKNKKTAFIYFNHIYPLDEKKIVEIFNGIKNLVLIENNSHAQFGKLLRQETGIKIEKRILKFDGRQILPEDIFNNI
jgi:2-oxoglutarate ferredoxin oxidoreductase subunit alpha